RERPALECRRVWTRCRSSSARRQVPGRRAEKWTLYVIASALVPCRDWWTMTAEIADVRTPMCPAGCTPERERAGSVQAACHITPLRRGDAGCCIACHARTKGLEFVRDDRSKPYESPRRSAVFWCADEGLSHRL